jgi:hypothetical protein
VVWAYRKKAFAGNVFNNTISNSDYITSKEWMTVNNELDRTWKEVVMTQFKVLFWHLPRQTEKTHKKYQSG